jgi:hypothetical protein
LDEVKNYYGKVPKSSADLQTNACCSGATTPQPIRKVLDLLAPEVVQRYYGCGLKPAYEDCGQAVVYKGTVADQPDVFERDKHHRFERGRAAAVCGNTGRMLEGTRSRAHFDFVGDTRTHYGIFDDCGSGIPFDTGAAPSPSPSGCC